MKIQVLSIGKVREPFYRDGIAEYSKRVEAYCSFDLRESAKERSDAESDLEAAYEPLRKDFLRAGNRVALDLTGRTITSEGLAQWLDDVMRSGDRRISFLIGGPNGLPANAIKDSTMVLSLSAMTLPHQMARLLLLEQLYRGFSILRGDPYHR
ncbi:MAG: 23S rRNA (pseudouridine(1915)-N(3))-methyltransferase RlmH [bacterium]|nr:MAG: 23S rRNA (pseudouridine(1915)-N(3))-methyltransferase RlmH [bacterium]